MSSVYTDSHAHLELVAARLGKSALTEILARYIDDVHHAVKGVDTSSGHSSSHSFAHVEDQGHATRVARRPALILDIGVDGGDLAQRKSVVEVAAHAGRLPLSAIPVKWAAGIWPGKEALAAPQPALEALDRDLASGVDALGECGLDYHHMDAPERDQIALFSAQAERAQALGLPLIVHSRDAFADTLRVVSPVAARIPVVIHCFGYGPSEVETFLRAGCYISFAGNITYKKSDMLRSALSLVPPDRLLLETDAPYMNPMPRRGTPSSPQDILRTYEFAASILTMNVDALGDLVTKNLNSILGAAHSSR